MSQSAAALAAQAATVVTFAEAGASRFIAEPADVIAPSDLAAFVARILAHLADPALRPRAGLSGHRCVRRAFGEASLPQELRAILQGVATSARDCTASMQSVVGGYCF